MVKDYSETWKRLYVARRRLTEIRQNAEWNAPNLRDYYPDLFAFETATTDYQRRMDGLQEARERLTRAMLEERRRTGIA